MAERISGTLAGFLAMAFVVVGLTGILATYTTPLPLERALAREATLDAVLKAAVAPDPGPALQALRPRLGDSADAVLNGPSASLPERVSRERIAMRTRFMAEARAEAARMRWIVCIATLAAALFGAGMMGVGRRT